MLHRVIWSLLSLHLAITNSINCVDRSGSAKSNEFVVNITTNCSTSSLTIGITYTGYHDNWFGIVFADKMTGDGNASALVYTTGKAGEAPRPTALYSYRLSSKQRDASGVTYNGANSDPKEITTQSINNTLQLTYYWSVTDDILNQNNIPFMWARGNNDHRLSYHAEDRAQAPVMITLFADDTTAQENISNITTPETTILTEVKTTELELGCGYIVLEGNGGPLARPLDVCTSSTESNSSIANSMMITCEDYVYTRRVYDDDSCNGTVISIETVGEDCMESADCVCGAGSECDYAVWVRYEDDVNETCDGSGSIEMSVVLNECTNGAMYECSANDTALLYQMCDEGGSNATEQMTVCDLECREAEVPIFTTTEVPEIESTVRTTEGTNATKALSTPAPTVSKAKMDKTVIIIGSVIGGFFFVLIVIVVCLFVANRKDKPSDAKRDVGYDAVGGNETENDTDLEMAPTDTR